MIAGAIRPRLKGETTFGGWPYRLRSGRRQPMSRAATYPGTVAKAFKVRDFRALMSANRENHRGVV